MILPRTTRRHAAVALGLIWTLVMGGLAWATRSAIRLDQLEAQASREKSDDARLERALNRMESLVAPVLDQEWTRPYDHFHAYYVPAGARDRIDGSDASDRVLVPSPLRELKGPDWLLLHFQGSGTEGWISPQLERGMGSAVPAGAIPAAERARQASAANWLAALRDRYTPVALLSMLEEALAADVSSRGESPPNRESRSHTGSHSGRDDDTAGGSDPARGAADFYRRSAKLLQLQRERFPLYQCEPETVALENLDAGGTETPQKGSGACVQLWRTIMMPIWLDLTLDARQQLALVRSVSLETNPYCTLQGALIDWERLRAVLEAEIKDIFPHGRVVPVKIDEFVEHRPQHGMMQRLPVRLEPNEPAVGAAGAMSTALKGGLAVAWGATILALLAITYGTLKHVTYSERRMQFVAAVTHELRTPLTSFQLYSDLLGDMPAEDGRKRRQYAGILGTESRRLARLIENVLAYSRVGGQIPRLNAQEVPLQTVLDNAIAITSEQCALSGKQVVIDNQCPGDLILRTDPQLIVQILANLVENACKYSADAPDPRVWLSVLPTIGGLTIEVDDAGAGVPPRLRKAVFDPFRRGNGEPQRKSSGVGLGLSLSRYWAECLGGNLTLRKSNRNGAHYSCFCLSLPVPPPVTI